MSKVTTKRLARGVRMLSDHVVGQLSTLLREPQLARIATENLDADKGTFRINLHVPVAKGQNPTSAGGPNHLPIWIPFTLPPTQGVFVPPPSSGEMPDIDGNYPRAVLTEIGFSFDQRSEAAAITRDYTVPIPPILEGFLDYEQLGRMGIKVSLYSKDMTFWRPSASTALDSRILTFDLPAVAFTSTRHRLNPAVQSNLHVPIDPLRTYVLEVDCPGLTDENAIPLQIDSMMISLKFQQGLMARDMNDGASIDVQNIPTSHNGVIPTSPASISPPTTASEPIRAGAGGTGTGIQTAFETIDGFFRRLLRGGYNDRSGVTATEQIMQDASYEVIAVPLFGNANDVYNGRNALAPIPNGTTVFEMPFGPAASGIMYDMRRIPLRYPFVLHHVVAAVNWSPNAMDTAVTVPVDPNFINEVGVGMGTGHHSEINGWDSLAYNTWNPTTKAASTIDSVNFNTGVNQSNLGFELMEIPLVGSAANGTLGTGYSSTGVNGKPIFIGSSSSPNAAREDLADGVNGAVLGVRPFEGKEQWIEVRWKMTDLVTKFGVAGAGAWKTTDIIVGQGGYWVFLIGKKQLV